MWSAWTDTFQEETERKKNILKIVKVLNNLPLNDEILSIHFSALNGKEKKKWDKYKISVMEENYFN